MKDAKEYLNTLLSENDTCILALSGGPDSMCLLHLLENSEKKLNIICAHVNHNTREGNEREAEFISSYLKERNIPLEFYKIESYKKNRFSEEEAREKRYQFLKDIVKKYNAKYLFTAHHGSDLTETILMRILRGSTLEGYRGIKRDSTWDNVRIIRPLLTTTKKEIMEYIEENKVPYVIDETNEEDKYYRNRIRHHMLPLLEQEEKNYHLKFLKFSETLEQANNLIKKIVDEKYKEIKVKDKINKELFLKQEYEMQIYLLKEYFKEVYEKELSSISDKHILMALKFLENNNSSYINLPKDRLLYNNNEYFWIEKKKDKVDFCIKCERQCILPNGTVELIDKYEEKNNYEIHLNSKEVKLPLMITTRKDGMKMEVKNLNGHKKVNDILINKKIPKELRDEIPIMVDSEGKVLWILGVSKSKYDLAKNENYDIIYKYIKRKEI